MKINPGTRNTDRMLHHLIQRLLLPLILIGILAGCSGSGIHGVVTNHEGEALPGVSIHLTDNTKVNAVTNTLGEYRLKAPPGKHTIQYAKSGYTLVQHPLDLSKESPQTLPAIEMWNLPPSNSVYLRKKSLYLPTSWYIPTRYYMADKSSSYGTTRDPELQIDSPTPFIVCHKMPRYDARLTRLQLRKAQLPQDETQTFDVWVPAGTIRVDLDPLVPSDTSLLKLNLLDPLDPGRYALHWGALEGYTTIDDRMYMFEIIAYSGPHLSEVDPDLERHETTKKHIEGDAP
jgi:hypothetical protein